MMDDMKTKGMGMTFKPSKPAIKNIGSDAGYGMMVAKGTGKMNDMHKKSLDGVSAEAVAMGYAKR